MTLTMPAEIAAMTYRACPICGADGMQDVTRRGGSVKQFYCAKCRNVNMATVPSAEQMRLALRVFTPWRDAGDD